MSGLEQEIQWVKGVGEKRARLLEKLGICTLGDAVRFYPRSYEDFSSPVAVRDTVPGEVCCVRAAVATPVRESLIRRGMTVYKLRAVDETGALDITFFNNRYIKTLLHEGEEYLFYGKIGGNLLARSMAAPQFLPPDSSGLMPVYPLTEGVTNRMLREIVRRALARCTEDLRDPLPDALRQEYGLCHLRYALEGIHFPKTQEELAVARRRLAFEELLTLQLGLRRLRGRSRKTAGAVCMQKPEFAPFYAKLPFEPTGAQRRAVAEAAQDMGRETPMNRLLQGDVGSGKTVVAAALCWYAARCSFQSVLMAPTEILAQQHFRTLTPLFEKCGVRAGLLTGSLSAAEKKRVKEALADGMLDVAVGTHALLQEGVDFRRLGLVVTDEQHRFGVEQRARLAAKGANPHTLVMSATPIPRTLALIIYGDLEISTLDELPVGRRPVATYLATGAMRARVYGFIKKNLDSGGQAFIVCPLIEAGEPGLAAAEAYADKIAHTDFSGYRVGLLHGRLPAAEKENVMHAFAAGETQLLVSTTVVEVGVDVPNANVMVVENAERFGLSQLHQLRGRVGRGARQSSCIFLSDAEGPARDRLRALCRTSDGFAVAQKDLELRGPGDFFGARQHGLPELKIAGFTDMEILRQTQRAAEELLRGDPRLAQPANAGLRESIAALFRMDKNIIFN